MFGFSLSKLLFTVLVIAGVWRIFKYLQTRDQKQPVATGGRPRGRWYRRTAQRQRAVDLVPCPKCGAYVPPGTDCPSPEECRLQPPRPPAST